MRPFSPETFHVSEFWQIQYIVMFLENVPNKGDSKPILSHFLYSFVLSLAYVTVLVLFAILVNVIDMRTLASCLMVANRFKFFIGCLVSKPRRVKGSDNVFSMGFKMATRRYDAMTKDLQGGIWLGSTGLYGLSMKRCTLPFKVNGLMW